MRTRACPSQSCGSYLNSRGRSRSRCSVARAVRRLSEAVLLMPARIFLLSVFLACAVSAIDERSAGQQVQSGQKSSRPAAKLARPPKWDRAVLETFFSDARQRLGPGPAPGQTIAAGSDAEAAPTEATTSRPSDGARQTPAMAGATLVESDLAHNPRRRGQGPSAAGDRRGANPDRLQGGWLQRRETISPFLRCCSP